jgi:hypothetical protein
MSDVLEFIFGMIFLGIITYGTIMAAYVFGGGR